jgi:WD40 repeat protein
VRQHQTTGSRDLVRSFDGHTDVVQALAYHAGTRRLASGSFDGEVRVWEADTGRLLSRFIAAPGYLASRNRAD